MEKIPPREVLAVILSAQPKETEIKNLRKTLCDILINETHPLIEDTFTFHPKYKSSIEIDCGITNLISYGSLIICPDYNWHKLPLKLYIFAAEVKMKISQEEFGYLKSLGERLK